MSQTPALDWDAALAHFEVYEQAYKELPLASSWFALATLSTLRARYDKGERTPELYNDMMEVEW